MVSVSWSTTMLRDEMDIHHVSTGFNRGYKLDLAAHVDTWASFTRFGGKWMWIFAKTAGLLLNQISVVLQNDLSRCTKENQCNLIPFSLSLSDRGGKQYNTHKHFTQVHLVLFVEDSVSYHAHTNRISVKRAEAGLQLVLCLKRGSRVCSVALITFSVCTHTRHTIKSSAHRHTFTLFSILSKD